MLVAKRNCVFGIFVHVKRTGNEGRRVCDEDEEEY